MQTMLTSGRLDEPNKDNAGDVHLIRRQVVSTQFRNVPFSAILLCPLFLYRNASVGWTK